MRLAEGIMRDWHEAVLLALAKIFKGRDLMAVVGSYPHQQAGWPHAFNRATIWSNGAWHFADKLDPTQPETRPFLAPTPPFQVIIVP